MFHICMNETIACISRILVGRKRKKSVNCNSKRVEGSRSGGFERTMARAAVREAEVVVSVKK